MGYVTITQRDKPGSRSKSIELRVESDAAASAVADAIDAITGNSVKKVTRTIEISTESGYGTGNLGREAVFQFLNADGKILPFRLRGVPETYFQPGGEIIATDPDIVAFVNAMKTNALLSDGEVIDALNRAYIVD